MLLHRAFQALASARRVSEMQSRIDFLERENAKLKAEQDVERSLKVSDIIVAINNYQTPVQLQMYNMLRTLIAHQDNNWIEEIRACEERLSVTAVSVEGTSGKKFLCLGVATDLLLILLRKANIANYADNTKMATLISLLTDYSKEKIRQRLSDSSPLPKRHQAEIDKVNQALKNLGIEDRLTADIR